MSEIGMRPGWTDERIEILKTKYAAGCSSGVIGLELGLTRGAVLGKLNRLGLLRHRQPQDKNLGTLYKIKRKIGADGGMAFRVINRSQSKPKLRPTTRPKPAAFLSIKFEDLKPNQCRYPMGDGPFLFCGQPSMENSSYCAFCHSVCHTAPEPPRNRNTTHLNSAVFKKYDGPIAA